MGLRKGFAGDGNGLLQIAFVSVKPHVSSRAVDHKANFVCSIRYSLQSSAAGTENG